MALLVMVSMPVVWFVCFLAPPLRGPSVCPAERAESCAKNIYTKPATLTLGFFAFVVFKSISNQNGQWVSVYFCSPTSDPNLSF
jgi:hypothetical protein